ncbi:MAG: hypothetical protein HY763_00800 [Planctomycetes bacterium]|nr:hypothetical protein [Planctomycetota bacterium]
MLVLISDLHLTDGTSGETIKAGAFKLFRERIRDLAYDASWRRDGKYRPVGTVNLLLLGDILDVIRSTQWLADGATRPWTRTDKPAFAEKVAAITDGILKANAESLAVLKGLQDPAVMTIPDAGADGKPKVVGRDPAAAGRVPVAVKVHYLVGNHDWFYHLPGAKFDAIRRSIVDAIGLCHPANEPFPHDPAESAAISKLYAGHRVFARHGDIYDPFNYEDNRDASSLGDAIVVELLNRFPKAVHDSLGDDLSAACSDGLREIDNVRPLLLIPTWLAGLLHRHCADSRQAGEIKRIWDGLVDEFVENAFVREHDRRFWPDLVDELQAGLKLSKGISMGGLGRLMSWWNERTGSKAKSYSRYALTERAFKNRSARYIVYGHTHHHEIVPLDSSVDARGVFNQMYLNSGTWRRVHELAAVHPEEQEFLDHYVMTYFTFFDGDERGGQGFESWSGALGM